MISREKKRKSGIPTGHAGEYFVMGELLRRGYDAQLADRNTKEYDLLVGRPEDPVLRKVQVKSVRAAPWYVRQSDFTGESLERITVYVLVGDLAAKKSVRYFIAKNREIKEHVHIPKTDWKTNAFLPLKALVNHENQWSVLFS